MDVERLLPPDALRPHWSSASALVYLGAFVVLAATSALLAILAEDHGEWALVGYAALATVLALGLALAFEQSDRRVAAGVLATLAVFFFAIFVGAFENVLGMIDFDADEYQPASLLIEALAIAAALLALQRFRAPLLVLPIALAVWGAFGDLASVASVDDAGEVVSVLVGIALIVAAIAVDRAAREPYAFWLHVVGGLAVGGGVIALVEGDVAWAFVGLLSLAYVGAAYLLGRSSYAVLGVVGILATTTYFALDGFSVVSAFVPFGEGEIEEGLDPWQVALSFVASGLVIVLLGLVEDRITTLRRR